jgi:hypothetical protein
MWPEETLPPHLPIVRPHRSSAAMTAGIVLTIIGFVAVPVGVVLASVNDPSGHETLAGILLSTVGPTVLPAVGIPLIVYGARLLEPWETAALPSLPSVPWWAIPSVTASAATRSVTLRWTF